MSDQTQTDSTEQYQQYHNRCSHQNGRSTPSPTDNNSNTSTLSPNEPDFGVRNKRKSNAHLAAEIVQQERDAIRALKRLSMGGGSLNIDPDFQIAIESEYNTDVVNHTLEKKKRRKSSSSLSSDNDDPDRTLTNDPDDQITHQNTTITATTTNQHNNNNNELHTITLSESESPALKATAHNQKIIKKLDTEKLLWVPAKSHPKIAPEKFRRHVQDTLDDFNESNDKMKNDPNEPDEIRRIRRLKKKLSIPSLKELTDELDRLSEMAGLAATDAVTLARSLSSSTFNKHQQEDLSGGAVVGRETQSAPTSPVDPFAATDSNGNTVDEDEPILGYGNSLRRNQFSTYSRSTRMKRNNKLELKIPSETTPSLNRTAHQPITKEQTSPVDKENADVSFSKKPATRPCDEQAVLKFGELKLDDEKTTDATTAAADDRRSLSPGKKTNHSRNRHAGSIISLDYNQAEQPKKPEQGRSQKLENDEANHQHQHQLQQRPITQKRLSSQQSLSKKSSRSDLQFPFRSSEEIVTTKYEEMETPTQQNNDFLDSESDQEGSITPTKSKYKSKDFLNLFRKKRSASSSTPTSPPVKENSLGGRSISFDDTSLVFSKYSLEESTSSSPSTSPKKNSQDDTVRTSPIKSKTPTFRFTKKKEPQSNNASIPPAPLPSRSLSPQKGPSGSPPSSKPGSPQQTQFQGLATTEEQHRIQKESLEKKLLSVSNSPNSKPNAPLQFQDSAFGFPLPPLSRSTIVMLDYRFPVHVERALYRLSHLKLANPKRELRQQVLLSNFMYAYLNLVNHTLYLQQLDEGNKGNLQGSASGSTPEPTPGSGGVLR